MNRKYGRVVRFMPESRGTPLNMETAGVLKHEQWVDFSKLVNNSFAEKAK